ncbi:rhodanese-like domain-containing protein [Candidatus Chlorohelix sp.]|uniref:rhodanese-like domain-containing protein n=1 Tax=Candidatus Chlorohelix sp. TaxID=3139201 RepID=UPI003035791A
MFKLFGSKTLAYENITPQEADQRIKTQKPLIIDVREGYEYSQGHIKGSKLIPLSQISSKINVIGAKDREIIVVCRSGGRSSHAANLLSSQGFTRIGNIKGGMIGWMRAGLPLE